MTGFPAGETLTIIGTASTDRFGDITDSGNDIDVPGCVVWPAGSTEQQTLSDTTTADLEALLPPDTAIARTSRVRYRGDDYDVDGEPFDFTNPFTGGRPGVQVKLRRVAG